MEKVSVIFDCSLKCVSTQTFHRLIRKLLLAQYLCGLTGSVLILLDRNLAKFPTYKWIPSQ